MGYISGVLETLLPVMIVLALGIVCRRSGKFSREGINTLKNVAVDIALPAVLLNAFATTNYSLKNVIIPILMFVVCVLGWLLGKMLCRVIKEKNRFVPYLTTGFEAGMLGYTLFTMLYGGENVAAFAIVDLGQVLFVFTMYKILLNAEFSEEKNTKDLFKSMVTSPIIIAIVVGVLLGATGLYNQLEVAGISSIFDTCVNFVAAPTSVLILLGIGYDLVLKDVKWTEVGKVVVLRLVIMFALLAGMIFVINTFFGGDKGLISAAIVMFILPPPYVLPIFADDESRRSFISSALTVSTLVSIVCFGALAFLK